MSIVITTPTGKTGSVLTDLLLREGEKVTLLARHPEKLAHFLKRGAAVKQGALDDEAFVVEATKGANTLFWVNPPNFATEDMLAMYSAYGRAAAAAIRANGIERVVHLSSIGAQSATGGGPIDALHVVESMLDEAAKNITHLRAAYFMENFFSAVPSIAQSNAIYLPLPGRTRSPMVATRDIAAAAAGQIRGASWTGVRHVGVHGPADVSFDEAAKTIGDVLGHPVRHVQVPPEAAQDAMVSMGLSSHFAGLMVELLVNMGKGTLHVAEPRTEKTTTPTTFRQFTEDTLAPAIRQAAKSAQAGA